MGENSDVFEPDSPDQSLKDGHPSPFQGHGRPQLDSRMSDSDLDTRSLDSPPPGGYPRDGLRVVANGCRDGSKSPIKPLSNSYYEEPEQEDIIHKTILVGDSGVGKTSLLVQFDQAKFQSGSFSATVGIGFTAMLVGDSGVGKTCLLIRFKDGAFLGGTFISTVGIDFRNKVVTIDEAKVKLQIWDTAGQERFRSVTHAYYRDAHALLLLYDVTNKNSFDNTRAWLGEIHEYAQDDVVIMLIGNKADMSGDRQIRFEDGERLAKEYGVAFMETSAKTGMNVELSFMAVARELKYRKSHNPEDPKFNVTEYVRQESQKSGSSCCSSA